VLSWAAVPQSLDGRRQHRSIESRRVGDALTLPTLCPSLKSTVRLLALVTRRRLTLPVRTQVSTRLRIDLDERIAEPQKTREEPQTVIAGGSWRIPEVQILAKCAYGALQAIIHRHLEVLKWVIIQENSSDLGHYFLPSPGRKISLHIYWTPPTRADTRPQRARGEGRGARQTSNRHPLGPGVVRPITPTGPVARAPSRAAVRASAGLR
jgi:hypothetical protein